MRTIMVSTVRVSFSMVRRQRQRLARSKLLAYVGELEAEVHSWRERALTSQDGVHHLNEPEPVIAMLHSDPKEQTHDQHVVIEKKAEADADTTEAMYDTLIRAIEADTTILQLRGVLMGDDASTPIAEEVEVDDSSGWKLCLLSSLNCAVSSNRCGSVLAKANGKQTFHGFFK